ncbi:MAG: hypothetical protein ACRDG4_07535 [Chloroflexota bacterium]
MDGAMVHACRGALAHEQGDVAAAQPPLDDAVRIFRQFRLCPLNWFALCRIGLVHDEGSGRERAAQFEEGGGITMPPISD